MSKFFRQTHPIITGFLILMALFVLFAAALSSLLSKAPGRKSGLFHSEEGIGVVELVGPIVSAEGILESLIRFRENQEIKAIVLRVDSPGGVVGASQEIYEEVKRTNQVKKVVASLGSIAASGGYYAALGAERIVANPGTLTGSVGVVMKFPDLTLLYDKIGYRSEVVKSGTYKDIGALDRPMTDAERALLEAVVKDVHQQFVRAVVESRGLKEEQVGELADGRVFSGEQAQSLGLLDELGNFRDAVALAARLAGLEQEPALIYPENEDFSLLRFLFGTQAQAYLGRLLWDRASLAYEWLGSRN